MSVPLPLLKRTTEDGLTFGLSPSRSALLVEPFVRMPKRAPGPGEQYRFHVDMGKCIGCKCCVVACNEQNGNPAAINWRRVGEIEGGWYPQAHRSYLSMGCNHCVNPTCMSGCPVDAFTSWQMLEIRRRLSSLSGQLSNTRSTAAESTPRLSSGPPVAAMVCCPFAHSGRGMISGTRLDNASSRGPLIWSFWVW